MSNARLRRSSLAQFTGGMRLFLGSSTPGANDGLPSCGPASSPDSRREGAGPVFGTLVAQLRCMNPQLTDRQVCNLLLRVSTERKKLTRLTSEKTVRSQGPEKMQAIRL